jgi:hypothetical protein
VVLVGGGVEVVVVVCDKSDEGEEGETEEGEKQGKRVSIKSVLCGTMTIDPFLSSSLKQLKSESTKWSFSFLW